MFRVPGGFALVGVSGRSGEIAVAAATGAGSRALLDELVARFEPADSPEDGVAVGFWALGPHGPRLTRRAIKVPRWSEVQANYARATAGSVGRLVSSRAPEGGRLILWHGPPGTGKTTALRALSRVWSDWCSVHYITDPEAFLATGSGYLVRVLTDAPSAPADRRVPWKLVVLEDSGELLAADARERTGQALSRLLNVTDGMLGQGMNVATW